MFAVKDLAGRAAQRVFGDFGTYMLRRTVSSLIGSDDIMLSHADYVRSDAPFYGAPESAQPRARDRHRFHA